MTFLSRKNKFRDISGSSNNIATTSLDYQKKLLGFYWLLKADKQIKVTEELLDNYKAINAALAEACGWGLKQPVT